MNITLNIEAPQLAKAIELLAHALSNTKISDLGNTQVEKIQPVQQNQQPVQEAPQVQAQPIQHVQETQQVQGVPTAVPTQAQPVQQTYQQQVPDQQQQQQAVPTSAPSYDMNQLAVAATQLMDAGRQSELLSLLASFGAQSLMALPTEQYGAFATKLRELGAKI